MHVMQADMTGHPLQHAWQAIVGAAAKRRLDEIPILAPLPIGVLELVLDEEHPDAGRRPQQNQRQVDHSERYRADQYRQGDEKAGDRHICRHDAAPEAGAARVEGGAL